jgi:uncharacterized protein DUF4835
MKSVYFLLLFLLCKNIYAQEIEASVSVDDQQITQENLFQISSLATGLEEYINNTSFTDIDWEGPKIPVDISISVQGGARNVFSARMIVTSKRYLDGTDYESSVVLRLFEQQWSFEYVNAASHSYNELVYNPFTTMIDYYMLLVIGADADTYGELDGTDVFDKARQICLLASGKAPGFDTQSKPGEFTKYNLVTEFADLRFDTFRKLVFAFFVDGLDQLSTNREEALRAIAGVIGEMAEFKEKKLNGPSVVLQAFFDAKAIEIAQLFNGYEDEQLFKNLMYLDPSNTMKYENARDY